MHRMIHLIVKKKSNLKYFEAILMTFHKIEDLSLFIHGLK